jgi:hypothetical protein
MRYLVSICSLFCVLTNTAYSDTTTTSTDKQSVVKKTTAPKQQHVTKKSKSKNTLAPKKFDPKNIFFNAAALYAWMSDGGINGTPFAETTTLQNGTTGTFTTYVPKINSNWGYQLILGYKLDSSASRFAGLSYTNVNTSGLKSTGVNSSGVLYNMLTQLGNIAFAPNTGFSVLEGPATAVTQSNLLYENIDLFASRPTSDDGGTKIKFNKALGLRATHINKSLTGQYSGNVPAAAGVVVAAQDYIKYNANYYGIGPEIGYGASYHVNKLIGLRGGGAAAFLAGYYSSSLSEQASAGGPVEVGPSTPYSSYTNTENHDIQSWTPLIFKADFSVILHVLHNKKTGLSLSTETGIAGEYILPTFTDDSYSQDLGQPIARFNNSLNFTYAFIKLRADID